MKERALAMCAGCLGAFAAATGKLAMSEEYIPLQNFCEQISLMFRASGPTKTSDILQDEYFSVVITVTYVIRGILLLLTLALNAAMWSLFVESMQKLNSGEAVVLNTGSNILLSAVLGQLIFGEKLGVFWWVGASFILCGIGILQYSTPKNEKLE